jgi:osmoprotectant transport system ATP-binding protein
MQHGKIVQYDTPESVLKKPANQFIEDFVGQDRLWKTPDMLRARDIMNKDYVCIGMDRSLAHAVELMRAKNCEALVVVSSSGNKLNYMKGMVGRRQLNKDYDHDVRMKDIMRTDVATVQPDTPLNEVLQLREKHKLRFIPVVEEGVTVGIITEPSILNVLTEIIPESEGF